METKHLCSWQPHRAKKAEGEYSRDGDTPQWVCVQKKRPRVSVFFFERIDKETDNKVTDDT